MAKITVDIITEQTHFPATQVIYNLTCHKEYDVDNSHYQTYSKHVGKTTIDDIAAQILFFETNADKDLTGLTNGKLSCEFTFCTHFGASYTSVMGAINDSGLGGTDYDEVPSP